MHSSVRGKAKQEGSPPKKPRTDKLDGKEPQTLEKLGQILATPDVVEGMIAEVKQGLEHSQMVLDAMLEVMLLLKQIR